MCIYFAIHFYQLTYALIIFYLYADYNIYFAYIYANIAIDKKAGAGNIAIFKRKEFEKYRKTLEI